LRNAVARFVRQSPALVVAMLALFVAMSGTAIAAGQALITGKQIKNSSITGADVKNKSLTARDFKGSVRGPRGLQGPKGDKGDKGDTGAPGAPNPNAANSDKLDGLDANQIIRGTTEGSNDSINIAGTSLTAAPTTLNDATINVPQAGSVLVSWSAWQECAGAEIAEVRLFIDGAADDSSFFVVPECTAAGDYDVYSFQSMLAMTAGAHTFQIRSRDFNGGAHNMDLNDSRLNLVFVPFNATGATAATSTTRAMSRADATGPGR
jgi:hypothetical protein